MAYKRNTADARESPSMPIARQLLALGAEVRAADPHVAELGVDPRVIRVELSAEEVAAADAVLVLVDHDDFDFAVVAEHARYVLDTRNCVSGTHVDRL